MRSRLTVVLGWSVLGLALAAMPAQAAETRVGVFTVSCDGTNKHLDFTATGLGISVARFVQSFEISVVDTRGALLYAVVRANNDEKKQMISAGTGLTRARADYISSLFRTDTDASGNVLFGAEVGCTPGAPIVVVLTVYYFS